MIVEHNDNPLEAVIDLAARLRVECVVLGSSAPGTAKPFGAALASRLPDVRIHTEE
jgi:hypothetical protein